MTRPWETLETVDTPDGRLELRRRGARDFLLTVDDRVVMTTQGRRSELVLGEVVCAGLAEAGAARVLIGGLGMGYTLRAALDALGPDATVIVAELNPKVLEWCRGPLAVLTDGAVLDARVRVELGDVREVLQAAARAPRDGRFDAIALDLYEGPPEAHLGEDPIFGASGLSIAREALRGGGRLGVWSEDPGARFEKTLRRAGFDVEQLRPGKGGRRHVVYLATPRAGA